MLTVTQNGYEVAGVLVGLLCLDEEQVLLSLFPYFVVVVEDLCEGGGNVSVFFLVHLKSTEVRAKCKILNNRSIIVYLI